MALTIVILAAGQGKRMQSAKPKVLHHLAGHSLLEHVISKALKFSSEIAPIVIYGHQGNQVREACGHFAVSWVEQKEQLGTGHALMQAMPQIALDDQVLVLYGDVPLIAEETLKQLIYTTPRHAIGLVTANLTNPAGYGRIKRDAQNKVIGIVEEKETNDIERAIQEINSGIYLIPAAYLQKWLAKLSKNNSQQEYYLTDIIPQALAENIAVHTVHPQHAEEIFGVNDRVQLAALERFYQRNYAEKLMYQGVTIMDPSRIDIRGELHAGQDVVIDIDVIIEGRVTLGDQCVIGAHSILRNATLGPRVEVRPHSVIDGAEIGADCLLGPFARLRPGTILAANIHIGNFVEIKNSEIGVGTKINHLSYIGDSVVGKKVIVGAGTITCNYDGVNKHRTVIHDDVFIGSNSQLVAPVTIGLGATIGAGSTITQDAPPHQLTLARAKQLSIEGWKRKGS